MRERNSGVPHDTEDKTWWLIHGEKLENRFVAICIERLKLKAGRNPEKDTNPYAPDLVVEGTIADLKVQNTPFFTASRYGLDPRFAVTFNRKDYERYRKSYADINIFFWIDWTQTKYRGIEVEYYGGIFRLPFCDMALLIATAPEHRYMHRRGDTQGNALSSFLLDIRNFQCLFEAKKR